MSRLAGRSTLPVGWEDYGHIKRGFLPPWVDLELRDGFCDLYELIQRLYKSYYNVDNNPFPALFFRDLFAALQKIRPLDRKHYNRAKSRRGGRRVQCPDEAADQSPR